MSADNGLKLVRQEDGSYEILELNLSTGFSNFLFKANNLEEAVTQARDYCIENVVEYGILFD